MDNGELVKAFKDLEHYLKYVWSWEEVEVYGKKLASVWREQGKGLKEGIDTRRELETAVEQLLFDRYGKAIGQIDEVLATTKGLPMWAVLVERLHTELATLEHPENQYLYLLASNPNNSDGDYQEIFSALNEPIGQRGIDELHEPDEGDDWYCWQFVVPFVTYYVAKMNKELASYAVGSEQDKVELQSTPTERIRWIGSAALFGQFVHELAAAGRIILPQRAGAPNWTAAARILYAAFDFRKLNGDAIKYSSLEAALKPEGDRDILGGKDAFKIYPVK